MSKNTFHESAKTQQAAKNFSRRGLLKSAAAMAAVGTGSLIPLIPRPVSASTGELEIFAWADYFSEEMIAEFQNDTGIKLFVTSFDSNAEALLYLKATKGQGFDLVFPSATSLKNWHVIDGLLQPLDESRLNFDFIHPAILQQSNSLDTIYRGQRYAMPFSWGAEGLSFDSSVRSYEPGEASWADQWSPENEGLVATRPHSALMTMALMLDGTGERLNRAYVNEDLAREVFGEALLFAIEHKSHVRQFWNDSKGLASAFTLNNCVVGQAWDGVAFELWKKSQSRFKFVAPKEGALAWLGTMVMPAQAPNGDVAYELINWLSSPKGGGMFMSHSGFNSVVTEAKNSLDLASLDRFDFTYNKGAAIDRLNWWRSEPKWFRDLRDVYVRKYKAA